MHTYVYTYAHMHGRTGAPFRPWVTRGPPCTSVPAPVSLSSNNTSESNDKHSSNSNSNNPHLELINAPHLICFVPLKTICVTINILSKRPDIY